MKGFYARGFAWNPPQPITFPSASRTGSAGESRSCRCGRAARTIPDTTNHTPATSGGKPSTSPKVGMEIHPSNGVDETLTRATAPDGGNDTVIPPATTVTMCGVRLVNDGVTVFEVFMRSLYHKPTTLSSPLTKKIHKKTPRLRGGDLGGGGITTPTGASPRHARALPHGSSPPESALPS